MSSKIEDLWPTDLTSVLEEIPPVTILKQQASVLGQRMKNVIEAEVETDTTNYQRILVHTFFLIAPALNFYRYPLFEVEHAVIKLYPATIKVTWLDKKTEDSVLELRTENEDEFKDGLKKVFADAETNKIISALLKQSQAKTA